MEGNVFILFITNIHFDMYLCCRNQTWFKSSLFMKYKYFDASQALKEGMWLRKFLSELKVVERCIITCYFVIIWLQKSQSLYATWVHWRKGLSSNHANCVGIHFVEIKCFQPSGRCRNLWLATFCIATTLPGIKLQCGSIMEITWNNWCGIVLKEIYLRKPVRLYWNTVYVIRWNYTREQYRVECQVVRRIGSMDC